MTEPMPMSLPDQARLAADILDALNTRLECPTNGHWRPSELRGEADHIEAEEREAAECASQAEQLAELCRTLEGASDWKVFARRIIEAGWRRES